MMQRRMRGNLERRRDRREKAGGQDNTELHDKVRNGRSVEDIKRRGLLRAYLIDAVFLAGRLIFLRQRGLSESVRRREATFELF